MKKRSVFLLIAAAIVTAGIFLFLFRGASSVPRGAAPEIFALAPDDAPMLIYVDFPNLRSSSLRPLLGALASAPDADSSYGEFVEATNFHYERDLDRLLVAVLPGARNNDAAVGIVKGRFDEAKFAAYTAINRTIEQSQGINVYRLTPPNSRETIALTFLSPERAVMASGSSAETHVLLVAAAARDAQRTMRPDLRKHVERLAGAPFFMLGEVSSLLGSALAVAPRNGEMGAYVRSLRWWDFSAWMEGEKVKFAVEGECDSRIVAMQLRLRLEILRLTMKKSLADAQQRSAAGLDRTPGMDSLVKHLDFSLDGRYVRLSSELALADLAASGIGAIRGSPGVH